MGCANVAHAIAALPKSDKLKIVEEKKPNLGIVTAYNDMLSAHKPYEPQLKLGSKSSQPVEPRQGPIKIQLAKPDLSAPH